MTWHLRVANASRIIAAYKWPIFNFGAATVFMAKRLKEIQKAKHFLHVLLRVRYFCSLFQMFKTRLVECTFF